MIKKLILGILLMPSICSAEVIEDCYKLSMRLKVPRVYNNTKSLGYRKYQFQVLQGEVIIRWIKDSDSWNREIIVTNLINKTHIIANTNVTYLIAVDNRGDYITPRLNYIGSNKKNSFITPTICFYMEAVPSYNIGDPNESDNTLLLTCSGYGRSGSYKFDNKDIKLMNYISGHVSGTLGCGCHAYGHVSPTRESSPYGADTNIVVDVAAVIGNWKLKFNKRVFND